jgi:dynein heavy chain 2
MMGQDDISWAGMKRFLGSAGIINAILGFDARQVSNKMKNNVGKIIGANPQSFEQTRIKQVSTACAPLAAWVIANIKYSEVLLKIEPLTSELDKLTQKLH